MARISSARRTTGASTMRPSRRKAPRPAARAAASPATTREALEPLVEQHGAGAHHQGATQGHHLSLTA